MNFSKVSIYLFATLALFGAFSSATLADVVKMTTGPNGNTVTQTTKRIEGGVQRTTTGPNEKSATKTVERIEGGIQKTITGPNEKSATVTKTFK
jgi:hypothetical protein